MTQRKPPPPEQEIAGCCLAGRLRLLNRVVTGLYDDALRPYRVRVSQMNVLVAIAAAGPLRAVDVARRLRMDASTLSRDLERLIDRGWVRSTPGEGRARRLEVTRSGRALLTKVSPAWREAQQKVCELLSPAVTDAIAGAVDALWAAEGNG